MAIDFTIDTTIARPVDDVFAYVSEPANLDQWQTNVIDAEVIGGGPMRDGSRLREVRRVGRRRVEQIVAVEGFLAPQRFGLRVMEGPLPVHGDVEFLPEGEDATRVRVHAFGKLRGAMRLAAPLLAIGLRREFTKQYALLKRILEER
jgi:Polyketide cyclase / dehydrase and lipid transport